MPVGLAADRDWTCSRSLGPRAAVWSWAKGEVEGVTSNLPPCPRASHPGMQGVHVHAKSGVSPASPGLHESVGLILMPFHPAVLCRMTRWMFEDDKV